MRSWKVTRFRGMISTQPGTTPEASFKVLALEPSDLNFLSANDCGKFYIYWHNTNWIYVCKYVQYVVT